MAHIKDDITDLEDILANHRNEYPYKDRLQKYQEDLKWLRHVQGLWDKLGGAPINPVTKMLDLDQTIESPFIAHDQDGRTVLATFPAGTCWRDIWNWFGTTFGIDVAHELMD